MTNSEVSDRGIKLFNEDKIDEWANNVAADDITFEDMALGYKASGKPVNIKNCFIYEFENGKIKSIKNYLDMMSMMGQLGLAG